MDGERRPSRMAIAPGRTLSTGPKRSRYELRPEDLLAAEKRARQEGMDLIGIYHSHPDCDAYFSETDLKNSCPWYSFVVLSVRSGALRPRQLLGCRTRSRPAPTRKNCSPCVRNRKTWPRS